MRILVNYNGNSDECIKAAFNYFGGQLTQLYIHTSIPPIPYCSALETCFYDPSYAEKIDEEYYSHSLAEKQRECLQNYPDVNVESIISRGTSGKGILSACLDKNPDLLILCRGNSSFNIFESGRDWSIVRTRCRKPVLELKGKQNE